MPRLTPHRCEGCLANQRYIEAIEKTPREVANPNVLAPQGAHGDHGDGGDDPGQVGNVEVEVDPATGRLRVKRPAAPEGAATAPATPVPTTTVGPEEMSRAERALEEAMKRAEF